MSAAYFADPDAWGVPFGPGRGVALPAPRPPKVGDVFRKVLDTAVVTREVVSANRYFVRYVELRGGGRTRTISDPYTTWNAWAEGATLLGAA